MSTVIEQIKEDSRLARMRLGQDAPDIVALKSAPSVRVALVPLVGKEDHLAWLAAASLELPENDYAREIRDNVLRQNTLLHAVRNVENLEERVFSSVEELLESLEDVDINMLSERYMMMKMDSNPAMDGLSDEQMADLKKVWRKIDLNGLSGRSWELAKALLLELSLISLTGRSVGFSSTTK
jgi:hypothetical protein